jgi:hypothetical protein
MSAQTLVSAASGVVLPSDLWTRRLPKAFAEAAPQLVETDRGWPGASGTSSPRR